jgi:tetratricopeptide (TPR) repeat protein
MSQEPSRYVQPDVSDVRVNRLWQNVSERLETGPARGFRWLALGVVLAGAVAGAVLFGRGALTPRAARSEHAALANAKLETLSDALAVTLNDGSAVKLASHSALSVRESAATAVALALTRGEVSCDVTHREGRKFSVLAGDVEVRVVGTQFSVKTSSGALPRVEVSVLRGVVEVLSGRRPGVVARVGAGQSWIQNAGELADRTRPPATNVAATDAPAATPPSAVKGDAPASAPQVSAVASPPSARELFEKAGESRRAGDAASAARAYEELLRLHPSDGRASLSAFELGRLRMDRLGDPAGAITALERAVALNIGPSFREDALARLVSIYASQGNFAACGRARERYLSSYPGGVHAAAVTTRCGSH